MKINDAKESDGFGIVVQNLDRDRSRHDGSKFRKESGHGKGSRNSSLNYISDNMVDQLSMNFGKRGYKKLKRQQPSENNLMHESNSVASILTKGGTVINPFNGQKQKGSREQSTKVMSHNQSNVTKS